MSKLVLFLVVEGKEVKRVLEIPDFKDSVTVTLIQSINDVQDQLAQYKIEHNSYRASQKPCPVDEFEANIQGNIDANNEQAVEERKQKEIEKSIAEHQAEEDRKGRERAVRLQQEEERRLQEMRRENEERRIKKQTTVSTKKATK